MSNTTIRLEDLRNACISALQDRGATHKEAEIVYEDYLDAELRGHSSHGFVSFDVALSAFPHGKYEIVEHIGSVLNIQGNGDCGHIVAREAIDIALKNLGVRKIYSIGISNITRFNTPGVIARYASERGAIAIVLEYGGKNLMTPYGGRNAALSTNPIGIGIPGTKPLFVLDIATSERAIGFVSLAKLEGKSIPDTWGVDKEGLATTDPSSVVAVRSFGGYKGFGLALAFEIIAGALVGVEIGSKGTLPKRGAQIFLIHPTIYGQTRESFSEKAMNFLKEVILVPAIDKNHPVVYPGQAGQERFDTIMKAGQIELPNEILRKAQNLWKA